MINKPLGTEFMGTNSAINWILTIKTEPINSINFFEE